jgi:hypothetical protein
MEKNNIDSSIEVLDIEKFHRRETSEEVQNIIERMPSKFGTQITFIVLFIFIMMLLFGWFIRYPDMARGRVIINSPIAPIKLVANSSGNVKLNYPKSSSDVKRGDVVAYIKSATSIDTLEAVKRVLIKFNPITNSVDIARALPEKVNLGELTTRYYRYYSSIHQLTNFVTDKLYEKQIASLENLHMHQNDEVTNSQDRINLNKKNLEYAEKFVKRDSILFAKKAAAESQLDRTQVEYLSIKSGISNARTDQIEAGKQAQQTISRIRELEIQKGEKKKELEIEVLASYNELLESITAWEQKYLLRSPFDGKIQFLKFWTDDQFVQLQEPMFTIVPKAKNPYGQVILKAAGAGKVKLGQEVIVKLDDFPYYEYGSIKGIVSSISLTTSTEKTQEGPVEAYLITLTFPLNLKTNYGKLIPFRHEIQGEAEIITNDRRLIERLFDNLRYAFNK